MSCFVTVADTIGTRIRVQVHVNRYPDIAKSASIWPVISFADSKTDRTQSLLRTRFREPAPIRGSHLPYRGEALSSPIDEAEDSAALGIEAERITDAYPVWTGFFVD